LVLGVASDQVDAQEKQQQKIATLGRLWHGKKTHQRLERKRDAARK
jgi:hypothetical protein